MCYITCLANTWFLYQSEEINLIRSLHNNHLHATRLNIVTAHALQNADRRWRWVNHLNETWFNEHKINNACRIKSNNKWNIVFFIVISNPWKGNCTKGWWKKLWILWLSWIYFAFNAFVHWLFIKIWTIPCYRGMSFCVVYTRLRPGKVPSNVYGPFGHTHTHISYYLLLCWQLWILIMTKMLFAFYQKNISYHVNYKSQPETDDK